MNKCNRFWENFRHLCEPVSSVDNTTYYDKEKNEKRMSKLNRMPISNTNACIFHIMFSNSGIFLLHHCTANIKPRRIIRQTGQLILSKKLGLSKKILKDALYTRKLALGIGLTNSLVTLVALILKLDIAYVRMKNKVVKII